MQSFEKNGQNLDPMFYWKWVIKNKTPKTIPLVVLEGLDELGIEELAALFPSIDFIAFDIGSNIYFPKHNNLKIAERHRYTDYQYLDLLSRTDYFYTQDENSKLEACLCGVRVFENKEKLLEELKRPMVLTTFGRIDNWEKTKNLLTR